MKRVLVTGAGGLVGRQVHPPAGWEIHAARVDLLDAVAAKELIERVRPSHLLHLAWHTEPGEFWSSRENVRWVEASLRLLRAFNDGGGERAVFAGSCAEYDWAAGGVCREADTPLAPATLYGACKHALRIAAEALCARDGVECAWGRIFFLHGPGEDPRRLLPSLARRLHAGEGAPMTHGRQVRDFLHSTDVGAAFAALLDSPVLGPVNIASGEPHTLAELARLVAARAGRPELLRIGELTERVGEPARLVADVRRLREEVGWTPRLSFEQGIALSTDGWAR